MISNDCKKEYYRALIEKNSFYEGIFFVGVKTTGIFCRPTCPARKPKYENCEFFKTAKDALYASYKPCKRCHPLSQPNQMSPIIEKLIKAVEANPERRWKNEDFKQLGIDESTARRQFKKRFNMTFVEYARARRIGIALQHIRGGDKIIDTQLNTGYESGSGFRDAFSAIMGTSPSKSQTKVISAKWLDTKLGAMIAMADENGLYLLEFVDRRGLEREVQRLRKRLSAAIIPGDNEILQCIGREVFEYFEGVNMTFKTPIHTLGSDFQKKVWHELRKIPLGQTCSYKQLSEKIDNPRATRAVANANGANQLALIIPCHRVIRDNGELGGYGGGLARKKWLINHEKTCSVIFDSKSML
jgi:AraC family transcriptional regulator, regulatory protein of adaptative response / methylated-DNA-[protein]-cysteine methyltransferase